jgi:hypothetical protein
VEQASRFCQPLFRGKVSPVYPTHRLPAVSGFVQARDGCSELKSSWVQYRKDIFQPKKHRMKYSKHRSEGLISEKKRVEGNCSPQVKLWRIKRLSLYKVNVLRPGRK